jgi:GntR family transcriptional regulator
VYHNYETVDPTFFKVNLASGVPIYLQLMERFRHAVESCLLAPGDQLPAIRTLAQQLVISPNTVVKVYTELDREGIIELRHGVGAFVLDAERHRDRGKEIRVAKNLVRGFVERLQKQGFTTDEIRRFVEAELNLTAEEARSGNRNTSSE